MYRASPSILVVSITLVGWFYAKILERVPIVLIMLAIAPMLEALLVGLDWTLRWDLAQAWDR